MGWHRHGGTESYLSGRMVWPLLALAATVFGLGVAISCSSNWKKFLLLKENCCPREDDDGGMKEDKISQLPDDILSEILSSLDLQQAARTSIFGRRWRNIWAHRSILVFDCVNMFGKINEHEHDNITHRIKRFVNAVDQTLRLASCNKINRVLIRCCFPQKIASDFSRWVQVLVSSGAVELYFQFSCSNYEDDLFPFPFDILFQAVSLKRLDLYYCALKPSFKGHFESLEYLCLCEVKLDNREVPSILSSCVNLQRFTMSRCKLPSYLYISGPCHRLTFLEIVACEGVGMIDLKAVNLTTFIGSGSGSGFLEIEYRLSCVPKLKQISVNRNGAGTMPYIFGEVAKCCPDIETILLQTRADTLQYQPEKISLFSKLLNLELLMWFESCFDLSNIIQILGACPVLEKFHLSAIRPLSRRKLPEAKWGTLCCYRHLKEVRFSGFSGTNDEIEFASCLLRHAPILERMLIQPYHEYFVKTYWVKAVVPVINREAGRIRRADTTGVNQYILSRRDVSSRDREVGQMICDDLSRQAVSNKVEICYGRNSYCAYTEHPSRFLSIFSESGASKD